jgi:hypothetical protein
MSSVLPFGQSFAGEAPVLGTSASHIDTAEVVLKAASEREHGERQRAAPEAS